MLYIFIILIVLYILSNIQENFICPKPHVIPRKCTYKFNGEWTKCPNNSLYPGEKCYACPWKRPGLDFKDNSYCCHRKCFERKESPTGDPYYCENTRGDGCVKKYSNDDTYCIMHMLYNVPAKVYDTLRECQYSLNKYKNLSKEKC